MKFLVEGTLIDIRTVYSWFDVYVNHIMVLHHINQDKADKIKNAILKAGGKQI